MVFVQTAGSIEESETSAPIDERSNHTHGIVSNVICLDGDGGNADIPLGASAGVSQMADVAA